MDGFLTELYHEEMEKGASAQMGEFMDSLSVDELQAIIGLDKVAVDGSAAPPLPDSAQGAELNAKQQAVSENVNREHLSSVPKRGDAADPSVSYQGEGKQPTSSPDEALQTSKEAAAYWADQVGRLFAKTAASPKNVSAYEAQERYARQRRGARVEKMLQNADKREAYRQSTAVRALRQGAAGGVLGAMGGSALGSLAGRRGEVIGGVGGAALGAGLGALRGRAKARAARRVAADKGTSPPHTKLSMGEADDMSGMGGMETTAAVKAKLAARALRATSGAPEHIKHAAAAFAGQQMAKLSASDWYTRQVQAQQSARESKGLQGGLGAVAGGALGALSGGSTKQKLLRGAAGAALGGGLGLAGASLAKKQRQALSQM